jgi:hypothetical protein
MAGPALAKHACRKTLEESGSEPPSVLYTGEFQKMFFYRHLGLGHPPCLYRKTLKTYKIAFDFYGKCYFRISRL